MGATDTTTNYSIEDTPHGRSFVVTGPWSSNIVQVLLAGQVDELVLNYARGFVGGSLEMLDGRGPISRLKFLDRSIVDLSPLERMGGLRELSVQAHARATLDLAVLGYTRRGS